jgi:hypothetical protein
MFLPALWRRLGERDLMRSRQRRAGSKTIVNAPAGRDLERRKFMKKAILLAAAIAMTTPLAACNSRDPGDRAVGGAAVGALAGGLIGGAATGRAGGALAGAAIGAAGGAIVGASTAPRRCVRSGYDYYGNPVCLRYAR